MLILAEAQRRSPLVMPAGACGYVTSPSSARLASSGWFGSTRTVYPNGPGWSSGTSPEYRTRPLAVPAAEDPAWPTAEDPAVPTAEDPTAEDPAAEDPAWPAALAATGSAASAA